MSDSVSLKRFENCLIYLALTAITFLLFQHNLKGFWRGDDTAILLHMLQFPVFSIFTDPAIWQQLSPANLTPWISLSFYIDSLIGETDPAIFYWHQLIVVSTTAFMTFLLLRSCTLKSLAFCGAILFLLGTPVAAISSQLMTRHYVEGLLFCLLSLHQFLAWNNNNNNNNNNNKSHYYWSVFFFLLSVTAKEIYVTLGVLYFFLLKGSFSYRITQSSGFVAVIFFYILWRNFMLKDVVGGYTESSQYLTTNFWIQTAVAASKLPTILLGNLWPITTVVFFSISLWALIKKPEYRLPTLVIVILVFTPLLPLIIFPGINSPNRYLFLPWFTFVFALILFAGSIISSYGGHKLFRRITITVSVMLIITTGLVLTNSVNRINNSNLHFAEIDEQMRFVWNNDQSLSFLPSETITASFWLVTALESVKKLYNPTASIPYPIVDELFLSDELPLFAYSRDCLCMQDITASVPDRRNDFLERLRPDMPLRLEMQNEQGLLSWSFGPHTNGNYNVVEKSIGNIPLPPSGRIRTSLKDDENFYLRFTSDVGWITYSPMLNLTADGKVLNWSRN